MPKDPQLRITLRRWFSAQSKYKRLRGMASASTFPFNTLRRYFSGKRPPKKNLQLLAEFTGIDFSLDAPSIRPIEIIAKPHDEKKKLYAAQLLGDLKNDIARCLSSSLPARKVLAAGRVATQVLGFSGADWPPRRHP